MGLLDRIYDVFSGRRRQQEPEVIEQHFLPHLADASAASGPDMLNAHVISMPPPTSSRVFRENNPRLIVQPNQQISRPRAIEGNPFTAVPPLRLPIYREPQITQSQEQMPVNVTMFHQLEARAARNSGENALERLNDEQIRAQNDCDPGFTARDRDIAGAGFTILLSINQAVSSAAGSSRFRIDSCVWQTTTLFFVGVFFLFFPWFSKEKNRKYFDSPIPKIGITNILISLFSFCINFFPLMSGKETRFSTGNILDNSQCKVVFNITDNTTTFSSGNSPVESETNYSEVLYILSWIACTLVMIAPLFWGPVISALKDFFTAKLNFQKSKDITSANEKIALLEAQLKQMHEKCKRDIEFMEIRHENSDLKKELEQLKKSIPDSSPTQLRLHSLRSAQPADSARTGNGSVRMKTIK